MGTNTPSNFFKLWVLNEKKNFAHHSPIDPRWRAWGPSLLLPGVFVCTCVIVVYIHWCHRLVLVGVLKDSDSLCLIVCIYNMQPLLRGQRHTWCACSNITLRCSLLERGKGREEFFFCWVLTSSMDSTKVQNPRRNSHAHHALQQQLRTYTNVVYCACVYECE